MIPISEPFLGEEEINSVINVLKSGHLVQGEKVREFEENFAKFCGVDYAVAVSSGTSALHLALMALGIGKGDEVITTPFSFIASSNAILYIGAKPVFVDIEKDTYSINPNLIESAVTSKTKAVLGVHLYGHPFAKEIRRICEDNNLYLIEDACQAHGASINNQKVGSIGDAGVFSFYATKNMTTGEGGMITTNNSDVYNKLKLLRTHGEIKRYHSIMIGYNFRMTDIQAAIGIEQLKKLEKFNEKRISNAKLLSSLLFDIEGITLPVVKRGYKHVFHQYTIRVDSNKRKTLMQHLENKGIMTKIYYPTIIPDQPVYKSLIESKESFPVAREISQEVLSVPIHPSLTEKDIRYISEMIKEGLYE